MEVLLKTKQDKKEFRQWLTALRSGTYKKGKYCLQSGKGFCCLGVACDLLIPEQDKKLNAGVLDGMMPATQMKAPQWLKVISLNYREKTLTQDSQGNHMYDHYDLTSINDALELPFELIADCLEIVYEHELEG